MERTWLYVLALSVILVTPTAAWAACPTFHTLTNGSAADASQVMDNFNYTLGCPGFTGNVGIGTSSPGARLDLVGNSFSSATAISERFIDTGGSPSSRNWTLGNAAGPNYGDFAFLVSATAGTAPSGTPVLDLAASRYVGINTGTPAARFDITGTAFSSPADIGLRFTETSASPNARNWLIAEGAFSYGDLSFLVSSTPGGTPGGTPVLYVAKSGSVGINMSAAPAQALEVNGQVKVDALASASSTALCINANVIASCSSSRRYKEDVRDARFGLKEIEAMQPVTFKWKGRDETDFGLIAEDVAKINPLFVTRMRGRVEGVKYAQLTAVVINALKELKVANDSQAEEIIHLKAKIDALEHKTNSLASVEK